MEDSFFVQFVCFFVLLVDNQFSFIFVFSTGDLTVVNTNTPVCGLYDRSSVENPPAITSVDCYMIQNVDIYTPTLLPKASIVVQNGIITCLGNCSSPQTGCTTFAQTGGIITPVRNCLRNGYLIPLNITIRLFILNFCHLYFVFLCLLSVLLVIICRVSLNLMRILVK